MDLLYTAFGLILWLLMLGAAAGCGRLQPRGNGK